MIDDRFGMYNRKKNEFQIGFTIVELLVVIVVIGILAAITIVSYSGISHKTKVASLKSDLSSSSVKIKLFQVEKGFFPYQINDCPSPAANNICLIASNGASYDYSVDNIAKTFTLIITADDGVTKYQITENSGITEVAAAPIGNSFVSTIGGVGYYYDHIQSVVQSSDGGYVVVGTTERYGSGASDIVIAKFSADGTVLWNKTWGGVGYDRGFSIAQTSDGGYIVAGDTGTYGAGDSCAVIIKYTSDGTLSWDQIWRRSGFDSSANSIIQASDDGYVLSGFTQTSGGGIPDALLVKFTVDGTLSWSRTWGGVNNDVGHSVIQTSDSGYIVVGETESYGSGDVDAFLAKYTSNGTLLWSRTWGGGGSDYGYQIIKTSDGGYAITGQTTSYGSQPVSAFIAKYASNDILSWSRTLVTDGTYDWTGARSMIQTSDGGYAVSGVAYGSLANDVFLVKYANDGSLSWSRTWGGSSSDNATYVIQTSDGGYAIVGETMSYNGGGFHAFLAKYNRDGEITKCSSPMCITLTNSVDSPVATVTSPLATTTSPVAIVSSPVAAVTSQPASHTLIVSP